MSGLTKEDLAILSAPVPKSEIKSYEGRGGKEMRYTSVEFVESRLAEVDPGFGKDVELGSKGITVHYTVKGVRRGDAFDYDNVTTEGGKRAYGTPVTNGLARACRRAAKQFGVARELWEDAESDDSDEDEKPARKSASTSSRSSGSSSGSGGASVEQKKLLKKFGVPDALVNSKKLTPGRDGTASGIIGLLIAARKADPDEYDEDAAPHIRRAVKKIDSKLLPLLEEDEEESSEDDDEE